MIKHNLPLVRVVHCGNIGPPAELDGKSFLVTSRVRHERGQQRPIERERDRSRGGERETAAAAVVVRCSRHFMTAISMPYVRRTNERVNRI